MSKTVRPRRSICLLYTSDAADERSSVDLGGRRIIKKKKHNNKWETHCMTHKDRLKQLVKVVDKERQRRALMR